MASLDFRPAISFGYEELAGLFTRGFEGYFVPIVLDAALVELIFRTEAVDLSQSLVALRGTEPVGMMTVARRGRTSRVQSMSVVKEARRSGVGRALIERGIQDARARCDLTLELEVITANLAAVALYESVGFTQVSGLVGFSGPGVESDGPIGQLVEVRPTEVATAMIAASETNLPWQISPFTLANFVRPSLAFRFEDHAYAVISAPTAERASIRNLWVRPEFRGQGRGRRLMAALNDAYPNRTWAISPIVPDGRLDAFMQTLGFAPMELRQWWMRMSFASN
ncbi:MAG: GNAT family N-acetyltransferase [Fimbriimonas sp.]